MNGERLKLLLKARGSISRAYADDRFPPPTRLGYDLRMFVVTSLWMIYVEGVPRGQRIEAVCQAMRMNNFAFWDLISDDLPRYEPESFTRITGCVALLPRAGRPCGRGVQYGFTVTNPLDGTWEMVGYCSRHREEGHVVREADRRRCERGGIPEPVPNRGGLLPSYLPFPWAENYAKASGGWTPPTLGICADDWPVLARVKASTLPPPVLLLLSGGEDVPAFDVDAADEYRPPLRVVLGDGNRGADQP